MANDAINHHRNAAEHFESTAKHHTEAAACPFLRRVRERFVGPLYVFFWTRAYSQRD
jgi:hypothetical protein